MTVSDTVVAEVESRCNCGFIRGNIANESFYCFPDSENTVTYRAKIIQTKSVSPSRLIDFISQWIAEDGFGKMPKLFFVVDKICEVSISSFADPECSNQPADNNIIAIVGGVVGGSVLVIIISITLIILVIAFLLFKSHQAKLTLGHEDEHRYVRMC